jgi:hypothetical protein
MPFGDVFNPPTGYHRWQKMKQSLRIADLCDRLALDTELGKIMVLNSIVIACRAVQIFLRPKPACNDAPVVCEPAADTNSSTMLNLEKYRKDAELALPKITLDETMDHMKCFTSPNPDRISTVYANGAGRIGYVTYAVSPIFDKLYIYGIGTDEDFRRQGYGLSIIRHLARTYRLPIITFNEVGSARMFWAQARQMATSIGSSITTMSVGEMNQERARWEHLRPDMIRLENLITQRFLKGESYQSAVGRGLE